MTIWVSLFVLNNVAVKVHVLVFVWTYTFISLGRIPRSGVGHLITLLSHLRKCQTVFRTGCTIVHGYKDIYPPTGYKGSPIPTSSPTFVLICLV